MTTESASLLAALEDTSGFVNGWIRRFRASSLRLPRPFDGGELSGLAHSIVESLAMAVAEGQLAPGSVGMREVEKAMAFAGGALGMSGSSAFDVVAFAVALRDGLVAHASVDRDAVAGLADWLCALAAQSYAVSRDDALRLRHRDGLERGTPVVMLTPELPAAFLVGEPDRAVLESVFGRLLLSVVRVGAQAVILDGSGLVAAADAVVTEPLSTFASHGKIAGRVVLLLVGLGASAEAAWRIAIGGADKTLVYDRFDDAVQKGFALSGLEILRRRSTTDTPGRAAR